MHSFRLSRLLPGILVALSACGGSGVLQAQGFQATEVARFDEPWAMNFLPDGRLLVTEKAGRMKVLAVDSGAVTEIGGLPDASRIAYGGQGGFGDVVLHPDFATNGLVYLSFGETGSDRLSGAAVARARLRLAGAGGALEDFEIIWRQSPKVRGGGHYGQRIAFGDGYLWISAGERQQGQPAQDLTQTLGKIIRLNEDGTVPADNPFADRGGVTAEIWSLGHRNPLGLAFDADGQLWNVEMGPRGGDELNRVERGANFGWPVVSNGTEYSGAPIPDHPTRPEFNPPAVYWVPSISPSSLLFYDGALFPDWQGDAFIGGLSSESIVRIEFGADGAREAERFDMGARIRAVVEGPDGAIWALEDGSRGGNGRLLKLTPAD